MLARLGHAGLLLKQAAAGDAFTFDATKTGANLTVSGNEITLSSGTSTVLMTRPKTTGKWQFEAKIIEKASVVYAGVSGDPTPLLTAVLGGDASNNAPTSSIGSVGRVYWALTASASNVVVGGAGVNNDIYTVCLNLDAATPEVSYYRNGTFVHTRVLEAASQWVAGLSLNGTAAKMQLIGTALTYPQSGFTAWGA